MCPYSRMQNNKNDKASKSIYTEMEEKELPITQLLCHGKRFVRLHHLC